MAKIIFVTGGARSGKSSFAESLFSKYNRVLYLATALAIDDEMKNRIKKHQEQRNNSWKTIEAYRDIYKIFKDSVTGEEGIFIDCVTIMVANLMFDTNYDWDIISQGQVDVIEKEITGQFDKLLEWSETFSGELLFVSNEIGLGIVPATPLNRYYRDIIGRVNQKIASSCHEAYLVISGIPLKIK